MNFLIKACVLFSSLFLFLGFFLYENNFAGSVFHHVTVYVFLAAISAVLILFSGAVSNIKYTVNQQDLFFLIIAFLILGVWLIQLTLVSGGYNTNAALNAYLVVALPLFLILSGVALVSFGGERVFALTFSFMSFAYFCVEILLSISNPNWVALSLLFSVYFLGIAKVNKKLFFPWVLFVGLASFYLSSRGVSLSLFLYCAALLMFNSRIFNFTLLHLLVNLSVLLTIPSFVIGALFLNTKTYQDLNSLSYAFLGKPFDSNRLVKWESALKEINNNNFLGFGLDGTVERVTGVYVGALHNAYGEYLVRGGLVGLLLFSVIVIYIGNLILGNRSFSMVNGSAVFISSMPLSFVYGVLGFTHWPATFAAWFTFGMLISSRCRKVTPELPVRVS